MNKTINKLAIKLLDSNQEMVHWDSCWSDNGAFGHGTVSHWLVLKSKYEWAGTNTSSVHDQLKGICQAIKNDKIYKLNSCSGSDINLFKINGRIASEYILDEEGNPKNFNPFTNGTYKKINKKKVAS